MRRILHTGFGTKAIMLCIISALVIVCSACAAEEEGKQVRGDVISRNPQTQITILEGEPVVIGVSAALTGPIGPRGLELHDAVIVGVERWKAVNGEQIGGHDITVWTEDDGCYEAGCTSDAADQLLRLPGLVGVVGPECSSGAKEAISVYSDAGVVMISASATDSSLTISQPQPGFFFRTVYNNSIEGDMQANYILSNLEGCTAWVIDDGESYGQDLADAAQGILENSNCQITRESIVNGTVDFSGLTARIADDNPDAVLFEGFNPEGALFYRQLRDAGYNGPFLSGDAVASIPNFVEPLGEQSEGVVFAGCLPPLSDELVEDYIEIVGHGPQTPFAAHAIDAVYILLDAVVEVTKQQGGALVIDPMEFREAVKNPQLKEGLSGTIAFDENGDRVGDADTIGLMMGKVENGEIVLFSQEDLS